MANFCGESSSMISYPNYKFTFPIKALGMFARTTGDEQTLQSWLSQE